MEEKTKPVTATPSKWEEKAAAKAKRRARREKEEAEEGKLTIRRSRKRGEDLTPLDFVIGEVKPSAGKRAYIGTYRWTDPKYVKYRQGLCVVVDQINTNMRTKDWFVCEQCQRVFIDAKPAAHRLDHEGMEDPIMVACQTCIMKLDRRGKLAKHGYQLRWGKRRGNAFSHLFSLTPPPQRPNGSDYQAQRGRRRAW